MLLSLFLIGMILIGLSGAALLRAWKAQVAESFTGGVRATAADFMSLGICPTTGLEYAPVASTLCDMLCSVQQCAPIGLYPLRRLAFCSSSSQFFGVVRYGVATNCFSHYFTLYTDASVFWPFAFTFYTVHHFLYLAFAAVVLRRCLFGAYHLATSAIRSVSSLTFLGAGSIVFGALCICALAPIFISA